MRLAAVRHAWRRYFPTLPHQSECKRRVRWRWGAFELLRRVCVARVPPDPWQQSDTTTLPVQHARRPRSPEAWDGPAGWRAGYG
jgi:hypothetical protein